MYSDEAVAEYRTEYWLQNDGMKGEVIYIIGGSRKTSSMRYLSRELNEAKSE